MFRNHLKDTCFEIQQNRRSRYTPGGGSGKLTILVHPVQYQVQRTRLTFQPRTPIVNVYPEHIPKRVMNKASSNEHSEKRINRRAKMARPARVRPSSPRDEHFEDLPVSANVSKDGIYFTTHRNSYYKGMRLFVTFPYSSPHDPMNCEYVAEVVRVEELTKGKFGVALHLKLSVTYGDSTRAGSLTRA